MHSPFFAGGLESLKASLLVESPVAFRRRMIFVSANVAKSTSDFIVILMQYLIDEQKRHDFERDGVVLLPGVIDAEWQDKLREAVEIALDKSENYFRRLRVWQDVPILAEYCRNSPAPGIVAQLLDTDKVNLFYDQVFVKEPDSQTATPWHNDQPYWPVRGWQVMTLWLALDPISSENGAMEFIRGSHRWQRWFQPFLAANNGGVAEDYVSDENFEPLPDFDANRDQYEILSWDMQPGDVLAFHALTVHGACGNNCSEQRRRAYAVRYTGQDARYYIGPAINPRLINATLKHGDVLDSSQFPAVFEN